MPGPAVEVPSKSFSASRPVLIDLRTEPLRPVSEGIRSGRSRSEPYRAAREKLRQSVLRIGRELSPVRIDATWRGGPPPRRRGNRASHSILSVCRLAFACRCRATAAGLLRPQDSGALAPHAASIGRAPGRTAAMPLACGPRGGPWCTSKGAPHATGTDRRLPVGRLGDGLREPGSIRPEKRRGRSPGGRARLLQVGRRQPGIRCLRFVPPEDRRDRISPCNRVAEGRSRPTLARTRREERRVGETVGSGFNICSRPHAPPQKASATMIATSGR